VIGKVLFSGGKKTKPIIIDGKLHLPPNSKWHKVKKMIRDAQVTATVASMSANLNAIKNEDTGTLLTHSSNLTHSLTHLTLLTHSLT
jgi:hypothetical protein